MSSDAFFRTEEWVDCSPRSVISVETSWLPEKKLVITGQQEVRSGVTVHTFVLVLADCNRLFDPSGFEVRFMPHHFHVLTGYDKLLCERAR